MTQIKLPKTYTIKGTIYARVYEDASEAHLAFYTWDPGKEYIRLKEVEVEVALPDHKMDLVAMQCAQLQAAITAVRGEAEAACNKLQGEINRLLQLTYVEAEK